MVPSAEPLQVGSVLPTVALKTTGSVMVTAIPPVKVKEQLLASVMVTL